MDRQVGILDVLSGILPHDPAAAAVVHRLHPEDLTGPYLRDRRDLRVPPVVEGERLLVGLLLHIYWDDQPRTMSLSHFCLLSEFKN